MCYLIARVFLYIAIYTIGTPTHSTFKVDIAERWCVGMVSTHPLALMYRYMNGYLAQKHDLISNHPTPSLFPK